MDLFSASTIVKILSLFVPGAMLGFFTGYITARYFDERTLKQAKLLAYLIILVWLCLILAEAFIAEVSIGWMVHVIASVPVGYVFDVDVKEIWQN